MVDAFKACPNKETNDQRCTCAYTGCSRHGICCKCVHYHLAQRELPQCYVKAGIR